MEGLTPAFWIQVILTVGAVAAGFGMLRADLKNIAGNLKIEREERQNHVSSDDKTFHDIRDELQGHHGRISVLEGQNDLAERIATAFSRGVR